MEYNILFTCAGRRVSLIKQFRRAMKSLGIAGRLIGADSSEYVAGMWVVDERRKVPESNDADYFNAIKKICAKDKIRLLVPLLDSELLSLSLARHEFMSLGTLPLVSDPDTVQICADSSLTHGFFVRNGIDCPTRYDLGDVLSGRIRPDYPLLLASASRSASAGPYTVGSLRELGFFARKLADPVVERVVEGMGFTFDVYVGLDGTIRTVVPMLSVEARNGQVVRSLTCIEPRLVRKAREVIEKLPNAVGPLTLRGTMETSGNIKFLSIEPGFGGGEALSILAGADSPVWILSELLGIETDWASVVIQDRCLMMRYDQEILLDHAEIQVQLGPAKPEDNRTPPPPV